VAQARGDAGLSGNVSAVKEILEAWNRGDREGIFARATDDLEWTPATVATIEGEKTFRGRDGMDEFFEQWGSTWETWDVEIRELRDLGDRVVVLGQVRAKGRGSGIELDQEVAYVFGFRDGLLQRGRSFLSHDEALAAAGAEERQTT
jgi:ketosteroid isomerase-like protein